MNVLITGGLGLVGANYAAHCLKAGHQVIVFDNEARGRGSKANEEWLKAQGSRQLVMVNGDVADPLAVGKLFRYFGHIDHCLHAAAQSSVNASMIDPYLDFRSNVIGTFNVIEAIRTLSADTRFIFMASNKVYDVTEWPASIQKSQYVWHDAEVGPADSRPFETDAREPYGASKIAGFYYTRCYAAMYGLPAVVCVPSGMYGPRQFGRASQGWLGWFVIATIMGLPITIEGDGFQVRDMLHVDDVNVALNMMFNLADQRKGEVFNLGGGPQNAISLRQAIRQIEDHAHKPAKVRYSDWRRQDNKVYISDCTKLHQIGWTPKVPIDQGIRGMCAWVKEELPTLSTIYP